MAYVGQRAGPSLVGQQRSVRLRTDSHAPALQARGMTSTTSPGAALACPACGHRLHRHPRRWHERLLSLLRPSRRYRRYACTHALCGWQGLLQGAPMRQPGSYLPDRLLDAAQGAAMAPTAPHPARKARG